MHKSKPISLKGLFQIHEAVKELRRSQEQNYSGSWSFMEAKACNIRAAQFKSSVWKGFLETCVLFMILKALALTMHKNTF